MVSAALRDGTADRRCVFEVFSRRLPTGRRYGVVAGTGRLIDLIRDFRFDADEVDFLRRTGVVDDADRRLAGRLPLHRRHRRVRRGRAVLPRLPDPHRLRQLRRVRGAGDAGPLGAQPRLRGRRRRRPDGHRRPGPHADRDGLPPGPRGGGGRRGAGRVPGRVRASPPTSPPGSGTASRPPGTAAHAFTLLHDDERAAFASQVATLGKDTTLLVDTYDITQGIRNAIAVAGPELRRGPDRLRRPGGDRPAVPRAARLARRHRDQDHRLR